MKPKTAKAELKAHKNMSTKHTQLIAEGIRILDPARPGYTDGTRRRMAEACCTISHLVNTPTVTEAKEFAVEMVNVWNTYDGLVAERDRLREALESLIDFVDCVGQENLIDSEVLKESYSDREEREDCLTEMFTKARAALNRDGEK